MATQEVSNASWGDLCDRFTRSLKGMPVRLETLGPAGDRIPVAEQMPLQELVLEKTAQCSDHLYLILGNRHRLTHTIIEPIHVKIQETDNPEQRVMRVDAETGTSLIYFPADHLHEIVDGLKLT